MKSNPSTKSSGIHACFQNCLCKDSLVLWVHRGTPLAQCSLIRSGSRFPLQYCRATSSLEPSAMSLLTTGWQKRASRLSALSVRQRSSDRPSHKSSAAQQPRTKNSDNDQLNWKAVGMGFSLLGQLLINESTGKTGEKRDHLIKVLMKIKPFQK